MRLGWGGMIWCWLVGGTLAGLGANVAYALYFLPWRDTIAWDTGVVLLLIAFLLFDWPGGEEPNEE